MIENGCVTSEIERTGPEEKVFLSVSNAHCWREVQAQGWSFLVRRLREVTMREKFGMNL